MSFCVQTKEQMGVLELQMLRYRIDFLRAGDDVFATHEIDYANDAAAIAGAHLINEPTPIGCCFQVWRNGEVIHRHHNGPPCSHCAARTR